MKIRLAYPYEEYDSIERAVKSALTPSPYSYEGELEGLRERINKQKEFIAKLIELIVDHKLINNNELEDLLGYGYEVEE